MKFKVHWIYYHQVTLSIIKSIIQHVLYNLEKVPLLNFAFLYKAYMYLYIGPIKLKSDLTSVPESELQSYSFWASFSDVNKIESNDDGCGSQSAG